MYSGTAMNKEGCNGNRVESRGNTARNLESDGACMVRAELIGQCFSLVCKLNHH